MKLAVYRDGVFVEEREFDEIPVFPNKPQLAFYTIEKIDPAYDPITQVKEGPNLEEDHVNKIRRYIWTVRDKTPEELDSEKERTIDLMGLVAMKILFNHENRIRTLEARPQVTAQQFRDFVKAQL